MSGFLGMCPASQTVLNLNMHMNSLLLILGENNLFCSLQCSVGENNLSSKCPSNAVRAQRRHMSTGQPAGCEELGVVELVAQCF